jgi:hypothetical protein
MKILPVVVGDSINPMLYKLKKGELCFPELVWSDKVVPLVASRRLSDSIHRMCTTLRGVNLDTIASRIGSAREVQDFSDKEFGVQVEKLGAEIRDKIKYVKGEKKFNNSAMREIFHLIQLWGGISARNIYVQGGGFESNWDYEAYCSIADLCMTAKADNFRETVSSILPLINRIENWGLAFASKHCSFWNGASADPHLPIFDSVLCEGLFGVGYPHAKTRMKFSNKIYCQFIDGLSDCKRLSNASIPSIERSLFNFFQSGDGERWISARKRISSVGSVRSSAPQIVLIPARR